MKGGGGRRDQGALRFLSLKRTTNARSFFFVFFCTHSLLRISAELIVHNSPMRCLYSRTTVLRFFFVAPSHLSVFDSRFRTMLRAANGVVLRQFLSGRSDRVDTLFALLRAFCVFVAGGSKPIEECPTAVSVFEPNPPLIHLIHLIHIVTYLTHVVHPRRVLQ